jgi:hypothetical protein
MELDLQSMELHMDLLLLALDTELDHKLVDLHLHLERLLFKPLLLPLLLRARMLLILGKMNLLTMLLSPPPLLKDGGSTNIWGRVKGCVHQVVFPFIAQVCALPCSRVYQSSYLQRSIPGMDEGRGLRTLVSMLGL